LWVEEIDRILEGIRKKGLVVLPLAELIGKPVMISITERDASDGGSLASEEFDVRKSKDNSRDDLRARRYSVVEKTRFMTMIPKCLFQG
jgi:hypothetical protein